MQATLSVSNIGAPGEQIHFKLKWSNGKGKDMDIRTDDGGTVEREYIRRLWRSRSITSDLPKTLHTLYIASSYHSSPFSSHVEGWIRRLRATPGCFSEPVTAVDVERAIDRARRKGPRKEGSETGADREGGARESKAPIRQRCKKVLTTRQGPLPAHPGPSRRLRWRQEGANQIRNPPYRARRHEQEAPRRDQETSRGAQGYGPAGRVCAVACELPSALSPLGESASGSSPGLSLGITTVEDLGEDSWRHLARFACHDANARTTTPSLASGLVSTFSPRARTCCVSTRCST